MRSPYVEQLTPGSVKKPLIPKRSSLDGRLGGTPGAGTPGTPFRGGGGGGGAAYGGGSSAVAGAGYGYSSMSDPFSPMLPQQLVHRRPGADYGQSFESGAGGGSVGGGGLRPTRPYVPNVADLTTSLNYACWVVVIGLSESKYKARDLFCHCGKITDVVDSAGNWLFLEFDEPAGADRALRMHGKVIDSGTIICVEKLTPSRAAELNFKISSKVEGDVNRQEFPKSSASGSSGGVLKPAKKRDSICAIVMRFFGLSP